MLFAAATPDSFYLAVSPNDYLAAISIVLAGGVLMVALAPNIRRARPNVKYLTSLLFLGLMAVILNELRKSQEGTRPAVLQAFNAVRDLVGLPLLLIAGLLIAVGALRYAIPITRASRRGLLAMSVFAAFTLVRGIWTLATINFDAFHVVPSPAHPGLLSSHRVVFIVFDEMDSEVAFTDRANDLSLPNFDAFRGTTVSFDSAYSPGLNTIESMPSYLLGRRVKSVRALGPRSFAAVLRSGQRVLSDTASSIFSEPAAKGARSAIVGFALPYCRLRMTAMVDHCEELPIVGAGSVNVQHEGFWTALTQQAQTLVPFNGRRSRIAALKVAIASSVRLSSDSSFSLVFVHLPLPHYPWVWDRKANQFRVDVLEDEGYKGNLALADQVLGRMQKEMVQRGIWDATTVIVTADHPWRLKLLRGKSTDARIPLMIKLPGMKVGLHVATPTNSIVISSLLSALLDGQIEDPAALRLRVAQISVSDSAYERTATH